MHNGSAGAAVGDFVGSDTTWAAFESAYWRVGVGVGLFAGPYTAYMRRIALKVICKSVFKILALMKAHTKIIEESSIKSLAFIKAL